MFDLITLPKLMSGIINFIMSPTDLATGQTSLFVWITLSDFSEEKTIWFFRVAEVCLKTVVPSQIILSFLLKLLFPHSHSILGPQVSFCKLLTVLDFTNAIVFNKSYYLFLLIAHLQTIDILRRIDPVSFWK